MNNKITAAIEKLNLTAGTVAADEVAEKLGDLFAEKIGKQVNLNKVTKRDASVLLVAFGADDFAIREHANKVARRMRSNRFEHGSWGATI